MTITTLAELKRALQTGVSLTLVNAQGWNGMPHKYLNIPRKIEKVQTNAIKFEGGSWLEFEKAGAYTFTENGFIVQPGNLHPLEYIFN